MAERGLSLDHSTIARWVLRYAPILSPRIRGEMRKPNRSWRVDETYVRAAGSWVYLYRAVDSEGDTIDFMLSPNRDLTAAKHFLQLALWRTKAVRPRVINVDGHPAYASAIAELKGSGELGRCAGGGAGTRAVVCGGALAGGVSAPRPHDASVTAKRSVTPTPGRVRFERGRCGTIRNTPVRP
jgi:transposase-like protein